MRPGAPSADHVAAGLVLSSTVDVWYGGEVTALAVPVASGRLVVQRDQEVPERLDVTVPIEHEGMILDPDRSDRLGKDGHELVVTVHVESSEGGRRWAVPAGRFQVQSWRREGAGIVLSAHGLLRKVKDHLRAAPRSPGRVSPIVGELMHELGEAGLRTSWVHPGLPGRSVPRDFVFGSDRLASVQELAAAWPARVRVDSRGTVEFLPPLTADAGVPVVYLTDGEGGTIVGAPSEGDRAEVFNQVIVRVKPEGDVPEWSHEDWIRTGRLAVDTYGWVGREVASDAIQSVAQAQSIASQELELSKLRARTIPIEGVPDWRLQVDDTAHVRTHEGTNITGRFTGVDLPLTSADGSARYDVGVVN